MTKFDDFRPRLRAAASTLRLGLDISQENSLIAYLEQLQRWNRTYNLTAVRDPQGMLIQHVFDSLAIVPHIQQILYKKTVSPVVVDVGSGAGLPGVVVAVMCPGSVVHCVDTVEKKATFIRYVAGVLKLSGLNAHHARIEELPPFGADLVVSRAFSSLSDFARLAGRHVGSTGHLLAMKGKEPVDEVAQLREETSWDVERIDPLEVPELDAQRCLVWLTQRGSA